MDRHPLDALSLTFGLIFVAIAAAALTGPRVELPTEWILPAVLVATGGGILAVSILRGRSRHEVPPSQPTDGHADKAEAEAEAAKAPRNSR